ncbi:hypothetical protein [Bradyrhizobium lupini]|uniref:hypothetical protein n=1 Tax=Rhizobium lupini TaxID=136996 RepID=UPI0034C6DCE7
MGAIEDRLSLAYNRTKPGEPKVYGGRNGASRIMRDGHDDVVIEAYDWFYTSRDSIEKDRARHLEAATSDDVRAEVEQCFTARLTDWDRQERACRRAIPKALREAKRNLKRAHKAWTKAELAIINFRPTCQQDAIDLLVYAGRDEARGVFFTPDDAELKHLMRNVAVALVTLTAN